MDPGQKLLQHLKTVPNLVNEDPSTITPTNTSFVDMPWSDFSKMLAEKQKQNHQRMTTCKRAAASSSSAQTSDVDYTRTVPEKGSVEDFSLGNWDASTGYQDVEHAKS